MKEDLEKRTWAGISRPKGSYTKERLEYYIQLEEEGYRLVLDKDDNVDLTKVGIPDGTILRRGYIESQDSLGYITSEETKALGYLTAYKLYSLYPDSED